MTNSKHFHIMTIYSTSEIYPISWGEVSIIEGFFRHNGKRYGCLTEFRENAIC